MEDEKKPEEAAAPSPEEPQGPGWEYKTQFGINKLTIAVIKQAQAATETQIEALRRRLERLTYGG